MQGDSRIISHSEVVTIQCNRVYIGWVKIVRKRFYIFLACFLFNNFSTLIALRIMFFGWRSIPDALIAISGVMKDSGLLSIPINFALSFLMEIEINKYKKQKSFNRSYLDYMLLSIFVITILSFGKVLVLAD